MSAGWTTIIEAKPEPLTVNCAETAVIVVDMQNDFCSKGGMFDRAGINISSVQKAVGPTRKVLSAARDIVHPRTIKLSPGESMNSQLLCLKSLLRPLVISAGILSVLIAVPAAQANTSKIYYGCVNNSTGELRVVSANTSCKSTEHKIQWDETGAQGPKGPQGPTGAAGPQGPKGAQGPKVCRRARPCRTSRAHGPSRCERRSRFARTRWSRRTTRPCRTAGPCRKFNDWLLRY
jgi:hypothetical protein